MPKHFHKLKFMLPLIVFACTSTNQNLKSAGSENVSNSKINRENYYDFYETNSSLLLTTNWLRKNDALPIIADELGKLGYKPKTSVLYELADGKTVVLDFYDREKDLGIVFNEGHFAEVKKEHRNSRDLHQITFKLKGSIANGQSFKNLPENIHVIQETWYWYQYIPDGSTNGLLNKGAIEQILRQDIQALVKK